MMGDSSRVTGCEIFAALLKGDRTVSQLVQATGVSRKNAELWLAEMRRSGLVYRRRGDQTLGRGGRYPVVHCLQSRPFEREDWK